MAVWTNASAADYLPEQDDDDEPTDSTASGQQQLASELNRYAKRG